MAAAVVLISAAPLTTIVVPGSGMILMELVVGVAILVMVLTMLAAAVEAFVVRSRVLPVRLPMDLAVLPMIATVSPVVIVRHGGAGGPGERHKRDAEQQRSLHFVSPFGRRVDGRPPWLTSLAAKVPPTR